MNRPGPNDSFPEMIYPVCAIRDNLQGFYPATVEQSTQSAIRRFALAMSRDGSELNFSPADFTLFHVGYFNSQKGTLEPVQPIVQLISGVEAYGMKNAESK